MTDVEVEVQISEYITVSTEDRVSTEFVDADGRRRASCGVRKSGRPYDVTARVCYEDGRKCFVRGKTSAGKRLVERLRAA
jgi:hypothetical protein